MRNVRSTRHAQKEPLQRKYNAHANFLGSFVAREFHAEAKIPLARTPIYGGMFFSSLPGPRNQSMQNLNTPCSPDPLPVVLQPLLALLPPVKPVSLSTCVHP